MALAEAIAKASAAGQWEVVARLADGLAARQSARERPGAHVVDLSERRRGK
jgi:hypothetical protein